MSLQPWSFITELRQSKDELLQGFLVGLDDKMSNKNFHHLFETFSFLSLTLIVEPVKVREGRRVCQPQTLFMLSLFLFH